MRNGLYSEFLTDWVSIFPKEQIHIIKMEEYAANRMEVLAKVFAFLGLGKTYSAIFLFLGV